MLFDRPARFLYRHGENLYVPMRMFATPYSQFVRIVIGILWLLVIARLLSDGGWMTALGIAR
jgi:ABC-type multidrug transport system permease subunit